jgi:hypothetical protein
LDSTAKSAGGARARWDPQSTFDETVEHLSRDVQDCSHGTQDERVIEEDRGHEWRQRRDEVQKYGDRGAQNDIEHETSQEFAGPDEWPATEDQSAVERNLKRREPPLSHRRDKDESRHRER